jgi:hypothetical protein
MTNTVTESYWKTFIRNLNPPKAARDISMIAALNAALAGGMVSFVQTVPPDIKNVMVSDVAALLSIYYSLVRKDLIYSSCKEINFTQ